MSAPRQRIIETAAKLFFERGYELVGVNELIEKSEVAKSTFYQHFPSKEKLCVEWLRQEAIQADAKARELLQSAQAPKDKVARKFDDLRDFLEASHFRGCPFSNTASVMIDENEACEVVRMYKDNARFFWQALALQVCNGPAAAKALGDAMFLLYYGAVAEAQNAKAIWPVESGKVAALSLCDQTSGKN